MGRVIGLAVSLDKAAASRYTLSEVTSALPGSLASVEMAQMG